MKTLILVFVLVSVLLVPIPGFAQDVETTDEDNWLKAFVEEVERMEEKYGIKFDADWEPLIAFRIPDNYPSQLRADFSAQYVPETQSFAIAPNRKKQVDLSVVKHELGHALADQISRRAGNGMWPDVSKNPKLEFDMIVGRRVISEGIGTYFDKKDDPFYPKDANGGAKSGDEWLPQSFGDFLWRSIDFPYHGGHWLVAPIINQYGECGIIYLVKHPLRFQNDDVRTAAYEYQRVALKKLGKKKCR